MKIKTFVIIMIFYAVFLSAQEILDNDVYEIEINDSLIVVGSKSGISWKSKSDAPWKNVKCAPLGASAAASLSSINFGKNIVIGKNGFAVRLELENDSAATFLYSSSTSTNDTVTVKIPVSKINLDMQLFGFDGFFYNDLFYFAIGDGGVAVFGENGENQKTLNTDFCVNSISQNYKGNRNIFTLSFDGIISEKANNDFVAIDTVKLHPKEYAMKFVNALSDSVFILTTDSIIDGNEILYRAVGKNNSDYNDTVYNGEISKAVTTPDGFIYMLDYSGSLIVCEINGKQTETSQKRQDILQRRLVKTNVLHNLNFKDISIFPQGNSYSIGFATDKGVLYSENEKRGVENELPFEYFYKAVPIKKGLKEVYAEPGIINIYDESCTFEYSLSQDDMVTIDILNYNMDFVCRIVENGFRKASVENEHSTDRRVDKWDGTINNRGSRIAPRGVYYFVITTQKGERAIGKVVVAR